jgi:hypothetical protein
MILHNTRRSRIWKFASQPVTYHRGLIKPAGKNLNNSSTEPGFPVIGDQRSVKRSAPLKSAIFNRRFLIGPLESAIFIGQKLISEPANEPANELWDFGVKRQGTGSSCRSGDPVFPSVEKIPQQVTVAQKSNPGIGRDAPLMAERLRSDTGAANKKNH